MLLIAILAKCGHGCGACNHYTISLSIRTGRCIMQIANMFIHRCEICDSDSVLLCKYNVTIVIRLRLNVNRVYESN